MTGRALRGTGKSLLFVELQMDPLLIHAFHHAANVGRAALYGTDTDSQLPLHLHADARVPFLGYGGPRYVEGNPVLLAINPGGGGDDYSARHFGDDHLVPLIENFVGAEPNYTGKPFESMSRVYMQHVQTWNLRNIFVPVLEACGREVDEVCYINVFPYRTRKNAMPSAHARRAAWIQVVAPLLKALRPGVLVALGKKAGGVAERHSAAGPRLFIVPRTNGDRYVSEAARDVLEAIRRAT